ncbi:cytochrome c oxidase assembly protein [Ornithinimicrobium pratense]|uniref:Cytochrome c oxidase assembly protein n=1 Tax=Ornithinimicrobium pratense TaxID=2593973 RepID=A0A5J6V3X7_9MICO|nr:cytochrome c oxidase assembly protein [Ornithinimicrobium pratense]QFG68435.1 cytochrome c oxidase assembly protein [Ornithinimicrobium pratense]
MEIVDLAAEVRVLLLMILVGIAYLGMARRWAQRRGRAWSRWRTASWMTGLVVLAAGLSPALSALAHHDPVAHMVQHLLVGMYAPLGLILAAPVTLVLGATKTRTAQRVTGLLRTRPVHLLSHPATATVLSAGGLWVLYGTPLYALTAENTVVHHLVLVHLVAAGALFTWAVAGPDPAPRRPGLPVRLGALLASAASHAVLAKLLYARAGHWPPGGHGPVDRAEAAAMLMYYGGDVAELLLATVVLAGWYARSAPRMRHAGPGRTGRGSGGGMNRRGGARMGGQVRLASGPDGADLR